MSNQTKGILFKVLDQKTGTGSKGNWVKQEIIVETTGQYPKKVCHELWGDKVKEIENLKTGQEVTVHFNEESKEYNNNWFTTLRAWKIEAGAVPDYVKSDTTKADDSQDLPF